MTTGKDFMENADIQRIVERVEKMEQNKIEANKDMRNASGYPDPTAYTASTNIDKMDRETKRFYKLLYTIFYICNLAGFKLEGRITLVDRKTGKVYN